MKGDILIIGYNLEQTLSVVHRLFISNSFQFRSGKYIMPDGSRIIPAVWYGPDADPRILLDGMRLDQIFIADDSRMNILLKIFPLLPELYASCSRSDIPVEFQISILNTDTWDSDFIEEWVGYKLSFRPGAYIY